ncbi:Alpha/Beta hydrolase protein [Gamsiella multidivaricata]|uniref:Alpha/Beta hydrolase protein n=1 Tax=Gamsiella multidivaricata TaxID=101098 RepID=UPI002220E20D|nr:Alpha/Beta hydrolase protein [Gamsiella multidivaricata]KAI7828059.1 Alpha/Beta hydrolase protein [Gamsiella multidivaricata]
MVSTIEEVKKVKFAEGFNPDVDCIRLSLDPVLATHRPLVYYVLLWLANAFAGIVLKTCGFMRYDTTLEKGHDFVSSNKVVYEASQNTRCPPDLAYWYRCPTNPQNEVPLVFIHGIGIGLIQYIHLIVALTYVSRPLILIEVPYVSSQLFQTDCMTPDETYFAIERILKTHGHPKATFMGHSLGTMLCAAVCRASSASSPKSIVAGLVLVDPVCFLTHHSIAHNFAYRTPVTASQLVMDLFAAREIGTSWYIMRRFCWNQSVMFPIAWARRHQEPLPFQGQLSPVLPEKTRVFLSKNDNLLNMAKVTEYLRTQVGLTEGQESGELVVMEGLDHAQLLLRSDWFAKIVQAAQEC